jgi:hypothetical protein
MICRYAMLHCYFNWKMFRCSHHVIIWKEVVLVYFKLLSWRSLDQVSNITEILIRLHNMPTDISTYTTYSVIFTKQSHISVIYIWWGKSGCHWQVTFPFMTFESFLFSMLTGIAVFGMQPVRHVRDVSQCRQNWPGFLLQCLTNVNQ